MITIEVFAHPRTLKTQLWRNASPVRFASGEMDTVQTPYFFRVTITEQCVTYTIELISAPSAKKPPRRAAEDITHQKDGFLRCVMEETVNTLLHDFLGKGHRETDSENIIFNSITVVPDHVCLVLDTHTAVKALSQAQ